MSAPEATHRPRELAAIALLALAVAACFAPVWLGGRVIESDAQLAAFFDPIMVWSDAWIGGWPALSDPVNYALYPVRLAFRLTGSFNAFTMAGYGIAAGGVYAYLRVLGMAMPAALVGGLGFAFSGFMLGHVGQTTMVHTAAWLAPALAAVEATLQRGRTGAVLAAAAAIAAMALAAHSQILLYAMLVLGLYLLWRLPWARRERRLVPWAAAVATVVLGVLLAAPALWLTQAYVPETARKVLSFERFVGSAAPPLRQLPGFFFPFLFGGGTEPYVAKYFGKWTFGGVATHVPFVVCLLAAPGVVAGPYGLGIFWAATGALALLLLVGEAIPWLASAVYALPGLGLFRAQGRHAFELNLALAVLAGFGCDALLRRARPRAWLPGVAVVAAVFVATLFWLRADYRAILARPPVPVLAVPVWHANPAVWIPGGLAVLALVAVGVAASRLPGRAKDAAVLGVLMIETLAFAWFLPALREAPLARAAFAPSFLERVLMDEMQSTPGRVLNVDGELGVTLTPERSRLFGLSSLGWYGPLAPERAATLIGIAPYGRVDTLIAEPSNAVLDLYGVRWVIVDSLVNPFHWAFDQTDRWRLVVRGDGASIHENQRAQPLAWLVGAWERTPDPATLAALRGGVDRPAPFAVAETALTADLESGRVEDFDPGRVAARWTESSALALDVESRSGGLLLMGVNHAPGWSATIDGDAVELWRADYALLAVRVPGGRHALHVRYRPPGWEVALGLAVLAIVATALVVGVLRFAGRSTAP